MTPKRIQRKRTKGWRMPPGAVYVGSPTVFGNPFRAGMEIRWEDRGTPRLLVPDSELAVGLFSLILTYGNVRVGYRVDGMDGGVERWRHKIHKELHRIRGKDLACWCSLDKPCHADTLLELANR